MKRGEIYYISCGGIAAVGCEQNSGRPAIIVSNDKNNERSSVVEVVYLTTKKKARLPTHVSINSSKHDSIALCEQITSVSTSRIGDYFGTLSEEEMLEVERAMMISVGVIKVKPPNPSESIDENSQKIDLETEIIKYRTELAAYKAMHENLIERTMAR